MTKLKFLFLTLCFTGFTTDPDVPSKPDDSRFTKIVLDDDLNEPMELAIADDGVIYYIERIGHLNSFDPKTHKKKLITKLNVRATAEDGLLGLALDPNFMTNRWLYLYYGDPTPRNDGYANVLARFELTANGLANRVEMLRVPLLHEGVSHSAGSLAFDAKGNLYLSTGDNTNPFESDGYSPSDDRPGRTRFDALKSSGNTNDLRGKILRIHPEPDGTYTIPEGNLFPKGTPGTRPEIYVMGCRNPFRISVDNRTGFLYWGEVGPDAGKDSLMRGPRGHDEINQARQAGNFGWPLFVGNNKPYYRYDFDAKKSGELFDAQKPVNFSGNNTGLKELPPAQSAFIWYPYADSPEFPELGTGGRNAMGGPVYYYDDHERFEGKFPRYFDKKLFVYDWMRGWVFTVKMKENGDLEKLERFLPETEFNHPVDMAFSKKGELYMLEYGTYWRAKNTDARLVRIEYSEGNRAPVAKMAADKTVGAAPLKVRFSAKGSFDYDKSDSLKYEWFFTANTVQGQGPQPTFTFTKPGIYRSRVRVTDPKGKATENSLTIRVGNEPPTVRVDWQGNRSFYFGESEVDYQVKVTDREDKSSDPKRTKVLFHYLPEGEDAAGMMATGEVTLKGKTLMEQSDCKACHALNNTSVGPSYREVAKRYNDTDIPKLAEKIINGGGGVWTKDHVMSAHPQLLKEDASEMVRYILSLNKPSPQIAPKGKVTLNKSQGNYFLIARYTDSGGLMGQDLLRLRPARFWASEADLFSGVAKKNGVGTSTMSYNENGAWICFKNLDLKDLRTVRTNVYTPKLVGDLEFRLGSPTGPIFAQVSVNGKDVEETTASLTPQEGLHDVYVVYREQSGGINIWKRLDVRWLEFGK
ncbi:PQQ-dependent sugar dehydrogenase [Runella slithyformis]|uniref:PKD domain containing protein n=1 Tax=Runella slithyformis (strain ATCC 29530 / DSM 19594 / LMG 11500 / NCIMB 11436 / LSU 4) TaxID=761193 RepID=A0A7U4E8X7_RUNSL|nr:PQQ-dependent sugar dehydrogenase [Runella slithyformis]AEI51939.1 PKD domain containing protein [Runella slithyformis DSM 19594]